MHEEDSTVESSLDRIVESISVPFEILTVYDTEDDPTVPVLKKYSQSEDRVIPTLNTYGPGPANAIRFGMDQATADVIVVTMADGSDDPRQIEELTRLVERGVVVAAASRYSAGGQQVGGPALKAYLSRTAGWLLYRFAGIGTRDATNSFKAYSTAFVREVGLHSHTGFEIGLELTAKARRLRLAVAEIPTIWLERDTGVSNFKVAAWIPYYLGWFRFAFGRRLTLDELRARAEKLR